MNRLWKSECALRGSDFDKYACLKPSAVLELFQDAAGQHAEELGVGFASMLERNYLWVMTRVKFKILVEPKQYQRVVVKTWPLEPNRINYRREYLIEDLDGNVLVSGGSEWVVIDSEKRKFVAAPDLYPFSDDFVEEITFKEKLQKIRDFQTDNEFYFVNSGFNELDFNNHVNNTKYANYVLNAISPKSPLKIDTFQIDFRKEVMEGEKLGIVYSEEDGVFLAKGINESQEVAFCCKIEYK